MRKRTQIICLHEGVYNSVDSLFARAFIKRYSPSWLRPFHNNSCRLVPLTDKTTLRKKFPAELKACLAMGGDTTLVVLADVDDDCENPEALKEKYWNQAKNEGISKENFEKVVFIFPKDRIENWIEFLNTGTTDEMQEGPRVGDDEAREAGQKLASICSSGQDIPNIPPSLEWSCQNWKRLVNRMQS